MPRTCSKCSLISSSCRMTCPACLNTKARDSLIVKSTNRSREIPVYAFKTTFQEVLDAFNKAVHGDYTCLYDEDDETVDLDDPVSKRFLQKNKHMHVYSMAEWRIRRLSPLGREIAEARGWI